MAAAPLPIAVSESSIRLRGFTDRSTRFAEVAVMRCVCSVGFEVTVCSVGFKVIVCSVSFEASIVGFEASSVDEWELHYEL